MTLESNWLTHVLKVDSPGHPRDMISKAKLNRLVLDYFIHEGYENAATQFAKEIYIDLDTETTPAPSVPETSIPGALDFVEAVNRYMAETEPVCSSGNEELTRGFSSIRRRREIKYMILKGDITRAIQTISTYYPTVIDANNLLLFKLLRLNLIEMIRSHKFLVANLEKESQEAERTFLSEILLFVRENLLSKVTQSQELLQELEVTMSLLCFNFDPKLGAGELPEQLKSLLNLSLRSECYRVVNRVILDLESNPVPQHFKGPEYVEFTAALLKNAPFEEGEGEIAETVSASVEETPETLMALPAALELKLEKIAQLWVLTEQRLLERKLIPEKRYDVDKDAL